MKKLMSLMLGMSLALTTVAMVFAQDAPTKGDTTKKAPKKSKKKDTTKDTTKS